MKSCTQFSERRQQKSVFRCHEQLFRLDVRNFHLHEGFFMCETELKPSKLEVSY